MCKVSNTFTSHAPFLKTLLEDMLQQNKGVKHERGWQGIDETVHPVREGKRRRVHRMWKKGEERSTAVQISVEWWCVQLASTQTCWGLLSLKYLLAAKCLFNARCSWPKFLSVLGLLGPGPDGVLALLCLYWNLYKLKILISLIRSVLPCLLRNKKMAMVS